MSKHPEKRIFQDIGIIILSIIVAILFVRTGLIDEFLSYTHDYYLLGAFVAGLFFTSAFTTAPAIAVLATLGTTYPILQIALVGALGSVIGDFLIFNFVKGHVSNDLAYFMSHAKSKRLRHIFKYRFVRWSLALLGALIIASPLPDELGLTLMGLSDISSVRFAFISYFFNALGILMISYVALSI